MLKKLFSAFFVVLLIIASLYGGYRYGLNSRPSVEKISGVSSQQTGQPANVDFSIFWDTWAKIQEKFVNRGNLDYQKMVYGATQGMVNSLGDPYTVFFPPEDSKKFSEDVTGSFEGIGAEIGMRSNILTIIAPLEDSPAKKAGLMAGDQVLKIDGKVTSGLSVDEAVSQIRGKGGTQVTLTITRAGLQTPKDYTITRDVIKVPVMKYELKDVGREKIAYVQLYQFTENAGNEFAKVANQILSSDAKGIVFDLRGNPGGYLDVAVDIAGWFTDNGALIVTEDYGNGDKNEHRSSGNAQLGKYPTVVLIDQGSASASEILAGALRDDKGVKLVGQKSFGKGSVQELENMSGGTSLKVTVAKWLTPSGHSIMSEGLDPDVSVPFTQKDADAGKDPQLDKALEMLK